MRFSQLALFLTERLPAKYLGLEFYPGPNMPDETANRFVVLTRTGGPGLTTEDLIDVHGWQFRCVGEQNSYDDAEELAFALDAIVLNHGHSQAVDGLWMVEFHRPGSPPTQLLVDNADRTHFVASYLASVQSALAT